jgi:four helix bundle protein
MIRGFQDLEVWRKAHKLVLEGYQVTNPFPRSEQFGIVSQLRRAAYSIPSNLAEGFGRRSTKELLQFLTIANGSAEELGYFLILSTDWKFMAPSDLIAMNKEITSIVQMMAALSRSLKNRPGAGSVASDRDTEHASRVTERASGVNR